MREEARKVLKKVTEIQRMGIKWFLRFDSGWIFLGKFLQEKFFLFRDNVGVLSIIKEIHFFKIDYEGKLFLAKKKKK